MIDGAALEYSISRGGEIPPHDPSSDRPMPGDAVRLTGPWCGADEGKIGIIDGMIGRPEDLLGVTWNYAAFRDDQFVSVSGGPGTIALPTNLLQPTDERITVRCWKWNSNGPGRGNSDPYTIEVPVWEWDGRNY